MIMFEELFDRKTFNIEKALLFGFKRNGDFYNYETDVLDGMFQLQITVSSAGSVDTNLIEKETSEEYVLYKTNAEGAFIGTIRTVIESVLIEVSDCCYDIENFKSSQTKEIIHYVRKKYGDELEFLWKKFSDNAIWRRKDSEKWYAAVLTVTKNKLGLDSSEVVEIIDLRIQPEKMEALLKNDNYYPGWHMNKKSWYTIILDGSVSTCEICERIDESYLLAL